MIAWYPQEMVAPPELTAVKVPKGDLLRRDWVNALADRVMWLALKKSANNLDFGGDPAWIDVYCQNLIEQVKKEIRNAH